MAFTYAGNLISNKPAVLQPMQIGADTYVGQPVIEDANFYGHVTPPTDVDGGAAPDATTPFLGLCVGIVNDPLYSSTYQADYAVYDSTMATVVANDNKDAAQVLVAIARPGDIWQTPVVKDTLGTALDTLTETTGDATGVTITHNSTSDHQSGYATVYCRTGANRGLYRIMTSGSATTKVVTVPFPYATAANDTFVSAQIRLGRFMLAFDSLYMAIDGNVATGGSYYTAFCHKLDLEASGEEKAWITLHPSQMWHSTSP